MGRIYEKLIKLAHKDYLEIKDNTSNHMLEKWKRW